MRIEDLPFGYQKTSYTCGPAAGRMMLAQHGIFRSERQIARSAETEPDYGTPRYKLIRTLREHLVMRVSREASIEEIREFVREGIPVLIDYIEPSVETGHYALVSGFEKRQILLHDPVHGPFFPLRTDEFEWRWLTYGIQNKTRGWMAAALRVKGEAIRRPGICREAS